MTDQAIDLDAIQAAAAAALAQPAEVTLAAVYEAHQCAAGCGRLATVVTVRLADSDVDVLCDVCYLLQAAAIMDAMPQANDLPADPAGG
jgi:hypothetical protein